jgi:hypothetical protein
MVNTANMNEFELTGEAKNQVEKNYGEAPAGEGAAPGKRSLKKVARTAV